MISVGYGRETYLKDKPMLAYIGCAVFAQPWRFGYHDLSRGAQRLSPRMESSWMLDVLRQSSASRESRLA